MELPEKIYLQRNTTTDLYEELWPEWFEARSTEDDIEYTRSDVLREFQRLNANKVIKWLNDQACLGWIEDVEIDKFIEKFKKDFGL